jgi:hypothetical protein
VVEEEPEEREEQEDLDLEYAAEGLPERSPFAPQNYMDWELGDVERADLQAPSPELRPLQPGQSSSTSRLQPMNLTLQDLANAGKRPRKRPRTPESVRSRRATEAEDRAVAEFRAAAAPGPPSGPRRSARVGTPRLFYDEEFTAARGRGMPVIGRGWKSPYDSDEEVVGRGGYITSSDGAYVY